jgi:multidrug efflux pump subunit AcrA (membrane-fusion protein)
VVEHGQLQWVFVVEESTARQRLVTLGERRDDRYPVLSGLRDGERVVVEPGALQDGAAVREREP